MAKKDETPEARPARQLGLHSEDPEPATEARKATDSAALYTAPAQRIKGGLDTRTQDEIKRDNEAKAKK